MSIKITKKNVKEISLKDMLAEGKLDRIISTTIGDYLGETLEQIIAQKLKDLSNGELCYEPEITDGKCTEGEKTPVCLWSFRNHTDDWMSWLRGKVTKDNQEIYVVFGLTNSEAKSRCEASSQDKQNYVKKIILPEQEIAYPESYHKEYINQNSKSTAFLISELYVAKENIDTDDIGKFYKAYFANGTKKQLNEVDHRLTTYAEIENRKGLEDFLNEKQRTTSDGKTGVVIAKLVYPYVASVS